MLPARWTRRFVLRLLLLYGLLVVPWPGLQEGYAALFRAGGNQLFRSFGSPGTVDFRTLAPAWKACDTDVVFRNPGHGVILWLRYSSRHAGYLPTATLIALVLATPTPWSRQWRALLLGLALVNGFVVVRVALALVRGFRGVDLFVYGPFGDAVVDIAFQAVFVSSVTSCVVPALIWILVTFRREDFDTVLRKRRPRRVGREKPA